MKSFIIILAGILALIGFGLLGFLSNITGVYFLIAAMVVATTGEFYTSK